MKKVKSEVVMALVLAAVMSSSLTGCKKSKVETINDKPGQRGSITATIYDRGNFPASEGTIEENRWTKWINENGPVDVKFVAIPRTNSGEKLNTLFASGSAPDLIYEFAPNVKTPLYEQKQLLPLDELIEKHSTVYKQRLAEYPQLKKAGTKSDGKVYEFGRINIMDPLRMLLIRKDWLDKLNLKVPTTTEELFNVAKAFTKQDPDGNGKQDTFGIALSYNSGGTMSQVFQDVSWVVKNGKVEKDWDNAREYLDFRKKLYDDGIVDRDFLNDKNGSKATQDLVTGKLGIYPALTNWYTLATKEYATLKKNVPTAELIAIPYPKSPAGEFNPTMNNPVQMTAVVNAKAKDPVAVMKFVDFMCEDSTNKYLTYGDEGVHWKKGADGFPEIIDQEKYKNEVTSNNDYRMLFSPTKEDWNNPLGQNFDLSIPLQKESFEKYKEARKIYMDIKKPYSELTHSEHMPQMPREITETAGAPSVDFSQKAIVSGNSYSVDQAIKDMKADWDKNNGKKKEEWMQQWYEKDKNNSFLAKDMYDVLTKQSSMLKYKQ